VAEDSSRIAPIHFVCRPGPSFVSSTHALQIIARCDQSEATGEARMFMQRTIAATMLAAETAEPFVFVPYRRRAGGQNLPSGDFPRPGAGAGGQFRGAQRHCHARASEWESSDNRDRLN
jgi:hypothetical protein